MEKTSKKLFLIILCSALIGVVNGLLGGGGGMLCVPALITLGGLDAKRAHATAVFCMLPISMISAIVYSIKTQVDFYMLALVVLGSLVGSFVGTKLLKKFDSQVISYIFVVVIFAAGFRMIF